VSAICREYSMFACIGMAEQDLYSSILYNTAFVIDPQGDIVCRYRKMNAEFSWACPGDPYEDNTFLTPWGRVGVLICSDCYHSLMPRVTALRGANLLLVPTNWPPVGGLDPLEVWRVRAMENGISVAVCNRTGLDATMDCRKAISALISARGAVQLKKVARTSRMVKASIPLNREGKMKGGQRLKQLAHRDRRQMQACCLNRTGIGDFSALLQLPQAGQLKLYCHCPDQETGLLPVLKEIEASGQVADVLHVLPPGVYEDTDIHGLRVWCAATGQKVVLVRKRKNSETLYWFDGKESPRSRPWDSVNGSTNEEPPVFNCGTARIHILPGRGMHHPELFLAGAKKGADLALVFNRVYNEKLCLLGGARTIEQSAVILSTPNGAGIWLTPEGHQRWQEVLATPGEHCTVILDTTRTRKKRFQDRIDYRTLLLEPEKNIERISARSFPPYKYSFSDGMRIPGEQV